IERRGAVTRSGPESAQELARATRRRLARLRQFRVTQDRLREDTVRLTSAPTISRAALWAPPSPARTAATRSTATVIAACSRPTVAPGGGTPRDARTRACSTMARRYIRY